MARNSFKTTEHEESIGDGGRSLFLLRLPRVRALVLHPLNHRLKTMKSTYLLAAIRRRNLTVRDGVSRRRGEA